MGHALPRANPTILVNIRKKDRTKFFFKHSLYLQQCQIWLQNFSAWRAIQFIKVHQQQYICIVIHLQHFVQLKGSFAILELQSSPTNILELCLHKGRGSTKTLMCWVIQVDKIFNPVIAIYPLKTKQQQRQKNIKARHFSCCSLQCKCNLTSYRQHRATDKILLKQKL